MATITINGFIYESSHIYGRPTFEFFRSPDMAGNGYVKVMPYTIATEIPEDFNPQAALIATLERKRAAAMDEAAKAERELARLAQVAGKAE